MSDINKVDWVMEIWLQRAYEDLADLITEGKVTFEEVHQRLKWTFAWEIADDFKKWWDEYE